MKQRFFSEIIFFLKKKMNCRSIMEVPRLKVIYINKGLGKAINDKKLISDSIKELTMISGQRAVATKSKRAISNFKLRKGVPIGVKVTLHNDKMYEFYDRLVNLALPRVRDFQGLSRNGFDGYGNYNLGIREQIIFPEIKINEINKLSGMNITLVTTSKNNNNSYELLKAMDFPFKK